MLRGCGVQAIGCLQYSGAWGTGGPGVLEVGPRAGPWVRAVTHLPPIPPGVVQSIKDHITKPTAMARGRVAHLIEWKGWSAQRSGWELSPAEDEHYCCLPDELREARFAAGQWGVRAGYLGTETGPDLGP